MLNKKGFTLSEVMVAIGVLGVLAALLVPAIMSNAPDNNKVMFKKAYSSLERTVEDLINDNTNYPSGTDVGGADCLLNGAGSPVECGFSNTTTTSNGTNNKFCFLLADKLNTVGTAECAPGNINDTPGVWNFTTTDGIRWKIYTIAGDFPVTSAYSVRIVVDTNGDKSPNCANSTTTFSVRNGEGCGANENPDTHEIGIRYDGKIQIDAGDSSGIEILENPTNNQKD